MQIVVLLSHGNATVKSGFSVNNDLLIENLKERTVVSQRLVYDFVKNSGGALKVEISKNMLNACSKSCATYHLQLEEARQKENMVEMKRDQQKKIALGIKEREKKKKRLLDEMQQETREIIVLQSKIAIHLILEDQ